MKLYCFFCTTPFQIMTAVHLRNVIDDNVEIDLYIVDQFLQAEEVAKRIRDIGIFRKVVLVCENDIINKNKGRMQIWLQDALSYFRINQIAKLILGDNWNTHYDAMYISSKAFIGRIVSFYFVKNKCNTEIIYFDDGLGSYYNEKLLHPRFADRVLRWLVLGRKAALVEPHKILLYDPNLFHSAGTNGGKEIIVESIPKWRRETSFIDILNQIFSYSSENNIEESIIIFDGLYKNEKRTQMDHFYSEVTEITGEKNVIIKKHPRDKTTGNVKLQYYSRPDLPFELICLNSVMNDKLLIALSTTAVVTPVLLFGEEPYVLTLNHIKEISDGLPEVQYQDFRSLYSDKGRFFEADTVKEALDWIRNFSEKMN